MRSQKLFRVTINILREREREREKGLNLPKDFLWLPLNVMRKRYTPDLCV